MKKVIKGKFTGGTIHIPEDYKLEDNIDVYIIVEDKEEDLLDETFGIWIDEPDYLENIREASESRLKQLGIN